MTCLGQGGKVCIGGVRPDTWPMSVTRTLRSRANRPQTRAATSPLPQDLIFNPGVVILHRVSLGLNSARDFLQPRMHGISSRRGPLPPLPYETARQDRRRSSSSPCQLGSTRDSVRKRPSSTFIRLSHPAVRRGPRPLSLSSANQVLLGVPNISRAHGHVSASPNTARLSAIDPQAPPPPQAVALRASYRVPRPLTYRCRCRVRARLGSLACPIMGSSLWPPTGCSRAPARGCVSCPASFCEIRPTSIGRRSVPRGTRERRATACPTAGASGATS